MKSVGLFERFTRLLCGNHLLPLRVRTMLARALAGSENAREPRRFSVPYFGSRYHGSTNSHIDWHVFYFGCYDPCGLNLLRFIADRIEDPVALDIGANAGNHMLLLSSCCKAVHCFEPYPVVLPQLAENIEMNQLRNVSLHRFGLSESAQKANYYENAERNFGAGSFEPQHVNLQKVPAFVLDLKRADDVLPTLGVSDFHIVKIDVEGHEVSVLRGMQRSIALARPLLYLEHGPTTHLLLGSEEEFYGLFPSDYEFYRVSHTERWTRSIPKLVKFDYSANANILAAAPERSAAFRELVAQ